jgi:hypothetical protein
MKYMGWSYPQLMACPEPYLDEIAEFAKRENDAYEEAKRDK